MNNKIRTSEQGLYIANRFAKEFLKENYALDINFKITENKRLKKCHGRFIISKNRAGSIKLKIDLSSLTVKYSTLEGLIDTVKHECIHYAMYKLGKMYRDGDRDFERELLKHKTSSNYETEVGEKNIVEYRAILKCKSCSRKFQSKLRDVSNKKLKRFQTSCCNAEIEFVERYVYIDEKRVNLSRTQKL